ncbi:MAG: hypothetical protein K0S74_156 [Chlamydiales bacterium]|jgi:hypothetical protein|nr:hypothetical protein [Chlamydiales bacterium]
MDCPLCGAFNSPTNKKCSLCDTELVTELPEIVEVATPYQAVQPIELPPSDTTSNIAWKKVGLFFIALFTAFIPWLLNLDLLQTPENVKQSRQQFAVLQTEYLAEQAKWDRQKIKILEAMENHKNDAYISKEPLSFNNIPQEILFSYLMQEGQFLKKEFKHTTITPLFETNTCNSFRILISKYRNPFKLLGMIVALEIEVKQTSERLNVAFTQLRCGSRILPNHLAWKYFEKELCALRCFESFVGGIKDFSISTTNHTSNEVSKPLNYPQHTISWNYNHNSFIPNSAEVANNVDNRS